MNILLTGASGNIGSSVLEELVLQGHMVRCLIRRSKANEVRAHAWMDNAQIEVCWGDLRRMEDVLPAVSGQEVIIHLGYVLPPQAYDIPTEAFETNVGGTRNLLEAAQQQERRPKVLFSSTYAVFGNASRHQLRQPDDPIQASELYTEHKIACEEMVRKSDLVWAIYRFADAPPPIVRQLHPMVFTIGLQTRMEFVHRRDAGLAVANGVSQDIWGRVWLIGGGTSCQSDYQTYLKRMLEASGLEMLPESAFEAWPWGTDWMDSTQSQALLKYQRHSFDDIIQDVASVVRPHGVAKVLLPLLRPSARWWMMRVAKQRRREIVQ